MAEVEQSEQNLEIKVSKKNKNRKPKSWDDDPNIDRWKIEKFDPAWNPTGMLEVSSFSTLFPQYREKYLQDSWPRIESALKQHGVACKLNLVKGSMTVSTTRKTRDPYIIIKAKELIKLLSRSVPAPQAVKILEDEVQCDIIKIENLVRNKERFVKRRQRLVGPNSSTLKALEILTNCYILVQGSTVAAMGSYKGLKSLRNIVEDCMQNILHPVYHIKTLMMKKELAKDPALANESWERFLPKFKMKNPNKKNPENEKKQPKRKKKKKKKKPYTPIPPPQPLSKVDEQLESGQYDMSHKKKTEKEWQEKQVKQTEKSIENKRKRDASLLPPEEPMLKYNNNSTRSEDGKEDLTELKKSVKSKTKELKKQKKTHERVDAEEFIAVTSSDQPSKKKSKKGSTVAAMGSYQDLKQLRRIVEDCMENILHPVYNIKTLMIKKALAKDPALANESWERFLPKFKNKNEKKIKKRENEEKKQKRYTPFPPPQPLSKVDKQLQSGEFQIAEWQEKQVKQTEKSIGNKRKRDASFLPPEEPMQKNNNKSTRSEDGKEDLTELTKSLKSKTKELKMQKKTHERVNAEEFIAVTSSDQPSKS